MASKGRKAGHGKRRAAAMLRLILAVALGAQTTAAMAADLGPANVAPPVVFTWTAFYLGADVGATWSAIQDNGLGGGNASSVMGGVSAGYNWQFAPFWASASR